MKNTIVRLVVAFAAIFAGIYAFIDPLGGLEFVSGLIPPKLLVYIILLLLAVTVALITREGYRRTTPSSFGVLDAGANRSTFDQLKFLGTAKRRIRAIGLSLPSLASEQGLNVIDSLLSAEVVVELIVCDPFSAAMPARPAETYPHGKQPASIVKETIDCFQMFRSKLSARAKANFTVYKSKHPFGIGLLQADDKILWSPVLSNRSGATAPYYVCSGQSEIGKCLEGHFKTLRTKFSTRLDD